MDDAQLAEIATRERCVCGLSVEHEPRPYKRMGSAWVRRCPGIKAPVVAQDEDGDIRAALDAAWAQHGPGGHAIGEDDGHSPAPTPHDALADQLESWAATGQSNLTFEGEALVLRQAAARVRREAALRSLPAAPTPYPMFGYDDDAADEPKRCEHGATQPHVFEERTDPRPWNPPDARFQCPGPAPDGEGAQTLDAAKIANIIATVEEYGAREGPVSLNEWRTLACRATDALRTMKGAEK